MILAFDTSGDGCSVALFDGAAMVAECEEMLGLGHADRLPVMIADLFQDLALTAQAVQGVIATVGPGSFTGVRVGIAAARALGLARGFDPVGVTSLAASAQRAWVEGNRSSRVVIAHDAKRGGLYTQSFDLSGACPRALTAPEALAETDFRPRPADSVVRDGPRARDLRETAAWAAQPFKPLYLRPAVPA